MHQTYHGLPAAASVEQAIILAQLLILKGQQHRAAAASQPAAAEVEGLELSRLLSEEPF